MENTNMENKKIQKIACMMASICTEKGELEKFCKKHSVSQEDFNSIQQQASDRLYTMLIYLLTKPVEDYALFMNNITGKFDLIWNEPHIDESLLPEDNK